MKKNLLLVGVFSIIASLIISFDSFGPFIVNFIANFLFILVVISVSTSINYLWRKHMPTRTAILTLLYVICFGILIAQMDSKDNLILRYIELAFIILSVIVSMIIFIITKDKKLSVISYVNSSLSLFGFSILFERIVSILPLTKKLYFDISHILITMAVWFVIESIYTYLYKYKNYAK